MSTKLTNLTAADGIDGTESLYVVKSGNSRKTTTSVLLDQDNMTDGTVNKNYTATEQTKLAGIETGADVTDAANVAAAGAVMESDTSVADMSFVGSGSDLSTDPDKLAKRGDVGDAIEAAKVPIFSTKALAEVFNPTTPPDFIRTAGYAAAGDGGGALWKKVDSASEGLAGSVIARGNFSDDEDWIHLGSGWAVTGGKAVLTSGSGTARVGQDTTDIVEGREYRATFRITDYTSGGVSFALLGDSGTLLRATRRSAEGTYTEDFTAPAGVTEVALMNGLGDTDSNLSCDNYHIQEIVEAATITDAAGNIYEHADAEIWIEQCGASPSNSAEANTAAIQKAFDIAVAFGKKVRAGAGVFEHDAVTIKGRIQVEGIGLSGYDRTSSFFKTPNLPQLTVFKFSETDGSFWKVQKGADVAWSRFSNFMLYGQGVDETGDAIAFDLPYTGNNNAHIEFNNMWAEQFSLYGFSLADTIGTLFTGVTKLYACGSETNEKGAGIWFYHGGWLNDGVASLSNMLEQVDAYGCFRGIASPDDELFYNSRIGGTFQGGGQAIRFLKSRSLDLMSVYTEGNTDTSIQVGNAVIIAPQFNPANDYTATGNVVVIEDADGSIRSPSFFTESWTMGDDTAVSIDIPHFGMCHIFSDASTGPNGSFWFRNTGSHGGGHFDTGSVYNFVVATALSGTDGTDGKFNISVNGSDTKLYLENRMGAEREISLMIMGDPSLT